jgi:outer membrane protein
MRSVIKYCFLSIFVIFLIENVKAQSPILENYIQQGLQSNLSLKQQNFELQKAVNNIQIAKSMFSPKVSFTPTYSLAGGGRSISIPIGDLLNPVYSTLNQLTKSSVFPQIENVNQLLTPNDFHDTKLSFSYPIFNTDIQYNYLIINQLVSVEEAKKRVLANELRYNITTAYLQYLQTLEAQKIFDNSRKVLQDFVRLNQKLVNNNVATKDIIYSAEYEVSKLDQQMAVNEKNKISAKAYFNFLLNKDLNSEISADTLLAKSIIRNENLSELKNVAITNRQEISQLNSNLKVSETAIKLQEMNAKYPQVFVGGNAGFQGYGYKFSGQGYYVAQIGLTWDLFHGSEKKYKIQQAKIQKDQLENKIEEVKQQIQLQVTQAYAEVEAAKKALDATKDGVIKAEKYFKVVESRYRNGQALLIEFIRAENDELTARISESLARYDILVKQAALDKASAIK